MSGDGLQFDKAEFVEGAPEAATCGYCQQPLRDRYWSVGAKAACFKCKDEIENRGKTGSGFGRFVRATLFGSFAGAIGAGIWYAIRAITNMEIGLISIGVGIGVGVAVKAGCRGRGGPLYQALAIFLTYTAICSTYVPYIIEGLRAKMAETGSVTPAGDPGAPKADAPSSTPAPEPTAVAAPSAPGAPVEPMSVGQVLAGLVLIPVFIMAFAYAAPFLGGVESLLGIAIISFGLYEAWKINRRENLAISGPFAVARPPAPAPAPVDPAEPGFSAGG